MINLPPIQAHCDMSQFTVAEMLEDLQETVKDILLCKVALKMGLPAFSVESGVEICRADLVSRLVQNQMMQAWIETELNRRARLN